MDMYTQLIDIKVMSNFQVNILRFIDDMRP